MKELEKTTFRISEITLQITELENEIATAKKKCDEATEKEMEVNEVTALQDFDKIQLSKIIEKVFIYGPGRMEICYIFASTIFAIAVQRFCLPRVSP